jgi:hypothetical protein
MSSLMFLQYIGRLCAEKVISMVEIGHRHGWTDDDILLLLRGKVRLSKEQLKIFAQKLDSNVETLTKLLDR